MSSPLGLSKTPLYSADKPTLEEAAASSMVIDPVTTTVQDAVEDVVPVSPHGCPLSPDELMKLRSFLYDCPHTQESWDLMLETFLIEKTPEGDVVFKGSGSDIEYVVSHTESWPVTKAADLSTVALLAKLAKEGDLPPANRLFNRFEDSRTRRLQQRFNLEHLGNALPHLSFLDLTWDNQYSLNAKSNGIHAAPFHEPRIEHNQHILLNTIANFPQKDPLSSLSFVEVDMVKTMDELRALSGLTSLSLTRCLHLSDFSFLESLQQMETLSLCELARLKTEDLEVLSQLPQLSELHLGLLHIDSLASLEGMENLNALTLSSLHALEDGSPLACIPNLSSLKLRDIKALTLPSLPSVESLQISIAFTEISGEFIQNFPNLKKLELVACTRVSIVEWLKDNPSLESLTLVGVNASLEPEVFASLPQLKALFLDEKTPEDQIEKIKEACPDCSVETKTLADFGL